MSRLIKLADNPAVGEEITGMSSITKGRKVVGPRTKLSAAERLDRLENSIVTLAHAVQTLAKGMYNDAAADMPPLEDDEDEMVADDDALDMEGEEDGIDYDDERDPMHIADEEEEPADELSLGDDLNDLLSEFDPYGGEKEVGQRGADATAQELPTNKARRRLRKDDASSNFGEKDSDIPGNRPLDPDAKGKDAREFLTQGGPGDGPGPVSKAMHTAIARAVRSELARAGIIQKAEGPRIGVASKIEKGVDVDSLFEKAKKLSFRELNRMRVDLGDLPAGIL